MAQPFAKKLYSSRAWKECRKGFIASVGGLCTRCLAKGLYVPGYIVHHKTYLNPENINDPDITLNWDRMEYLCLDCHNNEHMSKEQSDTRWVVIDGELKERYSDIY